jgi:hypothetical protein
MLADLYRKIDAFVDKYHAPSTADRAKMKSDLLDLIQTAVDHGEGKNQSNVAGIAIKAIKGLFAGKDKD